MDGQDGQDEGGAAGVDSMKQFRPELRTIFYKSIHYKFVIPVSHSLRVRANPRFSRFCGH
jgi:hypothetical protein